MFLRMAADLDKLLQSSEPMDPTFVYWVGHLLRGPCSPLQVAFELVDFLADPVAYMPRVSPVLSAVSLHRLGD